MSNTTFRTTVADIIAELSKLPSDAVVAYPIRWDLPTTNEIYTDVLKAPLTTEQWAEVSQNYLNGLSEWLYTDSEFAMEEALTDYLKTEEE